VRKFLIGDDCGIAAEDRFSSPVDELRLFPSEAVADLFVPCPSCLEFFPSLPLLTFFFSGVGVQPPFFFLFETFNVVMHPLRNISKRSMNLMSRFQYPLSASLRFPLSPPDSRQASITRQPFQPPRFPVLFLKFATRVAEAGPTRSFLHSSPSLVPASFPLSLVLYHRSTMRTGDDSSTPVDVIPN